MKTLFKDIKELIQVRDKLVSFVSGKEMGFLPTIKDAFLITEDEKIISYGSMMDCPSESVDLVIDAKGKMILPSWCDSHTHLVYAGNREDEFVDRIRGLSYEEIAKKGGGILNSAQKLQDTTEEDLFEQSCIRLKEVIQTGTGALEIKSGYGLTLDAEMKMLRVIQRLRDKYSLPIKSTFLGAHALPASYKENPTAFIDLLINEMIPKVASSGLAEYIDVFCEKGYFSVEDTDKILNVASNYGLIPKVHVNQFNAFGGIQVSLKHNARSVDHLEVMRDEDIKALKGTSTMPVALPGCSFFLSIPYTPARKMIDAGLPLALATDYNPGSAPSGNMNFAVSAGCVKMNMTPEEVINAATINGAYAMGLEDKVGSISPGKYANLLITKPISSINFLPYAFGMNQIDQVFLKGNRVK